MKYNPWKSTLLIGLVLTGLLALPASALEYQVAGVSQTEFYPSTLYEDVYGAEYQYGGTNVSDFDVPELVYGSLSLTSIGVFDKVSSLSGTSYGTSYSSTSLTTLPSSSTYSYTYDYWELSPSYTTAVQVTQFTSSDEIVRSDGTIGTLYIPAIDVYAAVKANEVMSYSVGHISSTSAWNGNVGICGVRPDRA